MEDEDKKEIIRKDEVPVRSARFIKINNDHERWLVPVTNNDDPAGSTHEPQQRKAVTQPFRTPSRATSHRSRKLLAASKDDPSSLQLVYQIDSAKKDFLKHCYDENPSYRTLIAWITLSIDPSCYQDVEINEEVVRRRITALFTSESSGPALAKEGFVYAFRDNDFQLVKIGSSTNLEKRKADIERKCGFVNGLTLVAAVKAKAYKLLEDIVHQDLAPHRRFFDCACGRSGNKKGFTRHQEYFQIDDAAAVSTLQLWADFVEEQPWEQDTLTGRIKDLRREWRDKLLMPSASKIHEKHEDHDERIKRWRTFLKIRTPKAAIIVEPSIPSVTSGNTMEQESAVAVSTESLAPDDTPSKPPRPPFDNFPAVEKPTKPTPWSSGIPKPPSSSKPEKSSHVQEQDLYSIASPFTFSLPHRFKSNNSLPCNSDTTQARGLPGDQSVDLDETKPTSIFQGISEKQPYTAGRFQTFADNIPAAESNPPTHCERAIASTSTTQAIPAAPQPFAHIQFDPNWSSIGSNHPAPLTQTGAGNVKSEQSTEDGRPFSPVNDPKTPRRQHQGEQSRSNVISKKTPTPCDTQEGQTAATTIITGPLAQSIFDFARNLLAKEVRPLPARTILTDLWQLRWPLACSVVVALQSPYIPSVLSLLMWSIFLPFFVAELRGWIVLPL